MKETTSLNIIETETYKKKPVLLQDNHAFTRKFYCGRKAQKNGRYWITKRCDILLKTIFIGKIKGKRGQGQHSWFRNIRN